MEKGDAGWHASEQIEQDGFSDESCPQKYLDMTPPVNIEWRKRVAQLPAIKRERRAEIRRLFKKNHVRIHLEPPSGYKLTQYLLDIEEVNSRFPKGRCPLDGLLYTVPLQWISKIEVKGEKHAKKNQKKIKLSKSSH